MKIEVELTDDDLAMVEAYRQWKREHRLGKPKRWEIISCYARTSATRQNGEAVFERLKLLGIIDHKRNGYCWLSEAFKAQAGVTA